jgi:hypothetical protein
LVFVRLAVWFVGGIILFQAAIATESLLITGQFPDPSLMLPALLLGGPAFVVIETLPHLFLQLTGRPSFWNRRG